MKLLGEGMLLWGGNVALGRECCSGEENYSGKKLL